MLKRTYRLPARIRLHYPSSQKTSFGIVKIAKNDVGHIRLGVIISKKVAKKAVDRNRIRRMLHAAVASIDELVHTAKDYVIIVHKNIADEEMEKVVVEMRNII